MLFHKITTVTDLHHALIRFPCLSFEEKPIADFVEAFMRSHGASVFRHLDNVWCELGAGENVLLLNSHLDVVPPSKTHPYPPFEPTVVNGKVYGRGAVDAKASGAAMLWAFLSLLEEGYVPPKGKVVVALTAGEENSKTYDGLEDLTTNGYLPQISAALVGEPTNLQPCIAQKGLLILNLHARGRTAHAARGHLGVNAITIAAKDILTLSGFRFDREDPYLGFSTLHVTMIEGGKAHNIIPDHVWMKVDIRSTPAYDHDEMALMVQEMVASEVEIHSKRIIPVGTKPEAAIVQACLKAMPTATLFGSPTASDWIFLKDIPTVKIGPGFSELSHTPDEHVELVEVLRGVNVYRDIIKTYFELT
ncbi:MAG TPA: M20/M25/M40 family metallo-hydrolase [Rhodothermales bacterium]|nr:M20/M25/M40 family metallo-hydrolase [Rhodothermales bacterium]